VCLRSAGEGRKEARKKDRGIKNSRNPTSKLFLQDNTIIRILAIERLNTIILLVFYDKISKRLMVCLDNLSALFGVP
jgi:hypothetical protein